MIITMTEFVHVRILINQYNIYLTNGLVLLAIGEGPSPTHPPVMGPDLAHNRASQPQYC